MPKQIVIYVPDNNCSPAEMAALRRRYPSARFVSRWEEGAIMWQDALKER